jgi:hypothetical protein
MELTQEAPGADLLRGIPLDGALTLFLSGSQAEGWASEGSNYNFYVVGDPPKGMRPASGYSLPSDGTQRVPGVHFVVGETRALIRYLRPEDVQWAITAVRDHELRPTVEIWWPLIEFLHRLSIGIPLHGAEYFEQLRAALDVDMLARYLTQTRAMYSESFYTDAVTRLRAGRLYDALLQGRLAFGAAVDSYTASLGETNPQEKWRHKRVARITGTTRLRGDFEEAVRGCGPDTGLEGHIATLLQRCSTLTCCVQLGCDYGKLTLPDDPVPHGVRRSLVARLARRSNGSVVVVDLLDGRAADLSPVAALVFGAADGRWSAEQLAGHAGRCLGLPPERATADVAEVIGALTARGFLDERGTM